MNARPTEGESTPPPETLLRSIVIAPGRVLPPYLRDDALEFRRQRESSLLSSRLVILATLFLATGALGLPMLWRSERFGLIARVAWSIVVTVYTVALIAGALAVVRWSVGEIDAPWLDQR